MKRSNLLLIIIAVLFSSCQTSRIAQSVEYRVHSNDVKIDMVEVKGGEYTLEGRINDGVAQFTCNAIVDDFYISKYEITNRQYSLYCKQTGVELPKGSKKRPRKSPVVYVDWDSAVKFCEWLSETTGQNYRLPSEAEWEYAAKGGEKSKGYKYAGSDNIDEVAWYYDENKKPERMKLRKVGRKKPNELGIYDMSGNVWEWCVDDYDNTYFNDSPLHNPINLSSYITKSARGGGWCSYSNFSVIIKRDDDFREKIDDDLGFRIVRVENPLKLETK